MHKPKGVQFAEHWRRLTQLPVDDVDCGWPTAQVNDLLIFGQRTLEGLAQIDVLQ